MCSQVPGLSVSNVDLNYPISYNLSWLDFKKSILNIQLYTRRAKTLGYFNTLENDDDVGNPIINEPGFDIFGQPKEVS